MCGCKMYPMGITVYSLLLVSNIVVIVLIVWWDIVRDEHKNKTDISTCLCSGH